MRGPSAVKLTTETRPTCGCSSEVAAAVSSARASPVPSGAGAVVDAGVVAAAATAVLPSSSRTTVTAVTADPVATPRRA